MVHSTEHTTATEEPYVNPDRFSTDEYIRNRQSVVRRHVMHWNRETCVVCGKTLQEIVDGRVEGCEDVSR